MSVEETPPEVPPLGSGLPAAEATESVEPTALVPGSGEPGAQPHQPTPAPQEPASEPKPDISAIESFLHLLNPHGEVIELRAFSAVELAMQSKKIVIDGKEEEVPTWVPKNANPQYQKLGPTLGYFSDLKVAARAAACLNYHGRSSVYVTLQEISPALLARAKNRLAFRGKGTEDADVEHYRYFGN